jgi:hypothetical protein
MEIYSPILKDRFQESPPIPESLSNIIPDLYGIEQQMLDRDRNFIALNNKVFVIEIFSKE